MTKPLPRSYAALIGGVVRDARVATENGREQLVIELETGAQYVVSAGDAQDIVVSELQPPTTKPSTSAGPTSSATKTPAVNLQAVAGAVQDILRDL